MCASGSGSSQPPQDAEPPKDPTSSFRLEISIAIGYQRKRALLGGAFEGHLVTTILLLAGVAVTALVVLGLLHLVEGLPF